LPRLHLAPQLSDRQQAESINLKPSEVRLSGLSSSQHSSPHLKTASNSNSQNAVQIKGILKKSSSEGVVDNLNGHSLEQNGRERREREVIEQRHTTPVEPAPLSSAPWRQRARKEASVSSGRTRRSAPKPEEHQSLSEDLQIAEQSKESDITD
ncbi:hypothetical protein M9458_005872, partial [Cirrhinus mrigala]